MEINEYLVTAILVIEVLFRVVPTSSNWSALEWIYQALNKLVPNNVGTGEESLD